MLRFADLHHTFIGECDGDASTHVDSDGEWSDCDSEVPESHSDEDEWTANGVIVRRPDRKSGRGSHNPQEVKYFTELFSDNGGKPAELEGAELR